MGCQQSNATQAVSRAPRPAKAACANKKTLPASSKRIANQKILDIPPRQQWDNDHGYCGQTSIQMCGLYLGNYICSKIVREIAGGELLIGENDGAALQKLGYGYQSWDTENQPTPQINNYLQWLKKQINKNRPVIVAGYAQGGQNQQYDHIYLAVGFQSADVDRYSPNDKLVYNDCYEEDHVITAFSDISDNRQMNGNGNNLDFVFPQKKNYGVAIKGITDPKDQFYQLSISLEESTQPNLCEGEKPVEFKGKITVEGLKKGQAYAILKYDDYKDIPKDGRINKQKIESIHKFTADSPEYHWEDTFSSDSSVFYRCVDASLVA